MGVHSRRNVCLELALLYPDLYKIAEPMEVEVEEVDEYVGCFADDPEDRLLGNEIKHQPDMTQAVCRTYCEGYDAHFYATQVNGRGSYMVGGTRTETGCSAVGSTRGCSRYRVVIGRRSK